MNKKLYYTVIAMALITMAAVIFVSRGNKAEEAEQKQVKIAPEKQLVKPDDVIEEAIIGDVSQEVVGNETVIM